MTYSIEFRRKVLKIKEKEKLSYEAASKRFDISKAALFRWSKRIEPQRKRNKAATKIDMEALKKDIERYPDSYCYERAVRLGASATGIRDAQYRLGITYKKNSKSSQSGRRKKIYVLPRNSETKG
jgi:transposase